VVFPRSGDRTYGVDMDRQAPQSRHRVFLAGASGVIGRRMLPLLVGAGHTVAGMTRSPAKLPELEALGAVPVLCDVFDAEQLRAAVAGFAPDVVVHQLTDLPDDAARIAELRSRNERMRREGTRNLLAAAWAPGAGRFLAQSIAWTPPGSGGATVRAHEQAVLEAGGVVIRYGQFYGPGTYFEDEIPDAPRIHVDEAARRTVAILDAPSSIVDVVE
jgi:nucleoside-diphosphate-sugar epimerase